MQILNETNKNYTDLPPTMLNTIDNQLKEVSSEIDKNNTPEVFIKNKRAYKNFLKLLKQGQFTSAVMTAKALNISRQTVSKWLDTPKAQRILSSEVNEYVNKIKDSKDWKAQAYLLDKATQQDKEDTRQVDITNLIQVNVTPNTPTTYIDTTS